MKSFLLTAIICLLVTGCREFPEKSLIISEVIIDSTIVDSSAPLPQQPYKETEWINAEVPKRELTLQELRDYIGICNNFMYMHGEKNINVDDLAITVSDRIVRSINSGKTDYTLDDILGVNVQTNHRALKIYSFGHDSGGTRGFITFPILTWKDNNGNTKAFNLSEYTYCKFEEIYRLQNDLFLLLGHESGSGACHQYIAYVIEIKDDIVNAEYKAFANRPVLNLCNNSFSFDSSSKILSCDAKRSANLAMQLEDESGYGKFAKDSIDNKRLFRMLADEYYEKRTIHLKFKKGKFVSEYKPIGMYEFSE